MIELKRMGDTGSDHFHIFIELCYAPRQDESGPDLEDKRDATEAIGEGREEAGIWTEQ